MSYAHLTKEERIRLESFLIAGKTQKDCARLLGRSASAISNEIARNSDGNGLYEARSAHKRSRRRKWKPKKKVNEDLVLQKYVIDHLFKGWSPEQIAGRLKDENNDVAVIHFDTIYWWVYQERRELTIWLRHGKTRRHRRKHGTRLREKQRELNKKRWIHDRPAIINKRSRIGDWEGDTVVGRQGESERILTYVERASGYLVAALLSAGTAENVRHATQTTLGRLPKEKRQSCTYDNGVEFSYYEMIERENGMIVYFAHPYSSWERGSNENTNGLLREYFPKKSSFATMTPRELKRAVNQLNHRPRKRLNYRTPFEVFHGNN
jgi:IS30 family transposase